MKVAGLFTIFLLFLSACSSTTKTSTSDKNNSSLAKNQEQLYCKQDIITGSKFTKRRCRTKAQVERDRRAAKELLNKQRNTVGAQGGQ